MIPVIDFQSSTVLEEIREAYTTVGFAVFTNTLNKQDQTQQPPRLFPLLPYWSPIVVTWVQACLFVSSTTCRPSRLPGFALEGSSCPTTFLQIGGSNRGKIMRFVCCFLFLLMFFPGFHWVEITQLADYRFLIVFAMLFI